MTEDWKIMRNAANVRYFTCKSFIHEAFYTMMKPHTDATLQNDSNTARHIERSTLKQRYHSFYDTSSACKLQLWTYNKTTA